MQESDCDPARRSASTPTRARPGSPVRTQRRGGRLGLRSELSRHSGAPCAAWEALERGLALPLPGGPGPLGAALVAPDSRSPPLGEAEFVLDELILASFCFFCIACGVALNNNVS